MSTTAHLKLDTRRIKKNGTYPIIIRLTHKRKSLTIKTGYSCRESDWTGASIRPNKYMLNVGRTNSKITKMFAGVQNYLDKAEFFLGLKGKSLEVISTNGLKTLIKTHLIEGKTLSGQIVDNKKILLLSEAIVKYMKFLRGTDNSVEEYERTIRTEKYLSKTESHLNFLLLTIGNKQVAEISKSDVNKYYGAISTKISYQSQTKIKPGTYNIYIRHPKKLFDWLLGKGEVTSNPFVSLRKKKVVVPAPRMLYMSEFHEVLDVIDKGDGIRKIKTKRKGLEYTLNLNVYPYWLKDAIKLGLYGGGRRREEIIMARLSDVYVNEFTGDLVGGVLKYENLKVLRLEGEGVLPVEVPITKQLANLLIELGWKDKRGSSDFIIAPEIEDRNHMMYLLSMGFTHAYEQIRNPREGITFKCIRKLYITYLRSILGTFAKEITGHTNDRVIDLHYEDKTLIREKVVENLKF